MWSQRVEEGTSSAALRRPPGGTGPRYGFGRAAGACGGRGSVTFGREADAWSSPPSGPSRFPNALRGASA